MFYVKIDSRERDIIALVKEKLEGAVNVELITESLPVGDIIFAQDDKEILIIERKKVSDLAASIMDGRYKEQSYRLDGHPIHNHSVMYLIEGNLNNSRVDKHTLHSCIFSLNHIKGFSVWRTTNLEESSVFIANSIKYLAKSSKEGYYANSAGVGSGGDEKDYVSVVKSTKKENITPNNIGEIMLCQIPGVSANAAIAILGQFKCIVNLIAELQEQGEECLRGIEVPNTKGGSKRLNKTCIANIVKFLDP